MSKIYITSDLHFYHKNIIKHCNRPPPTEELNDWIINKLNSKINPEDTVYHLGDFSFKCKVHQYTDLFSKLNGSWKFIIGNHDNEHYLREACKQINGFTCLGHYCEEKIDGVKIVLCHYPIESWNAMHRSRPHFHGHLHNTNHHGSYKKMDNRFNVCMDNHPNFEPFLFDDLREQFIDVKEKENG